MYWWYTNSWNHIPVAWKYYYHNMKALILDCWSKFNIGKHRIGVVSLPLNFMSLNSAQGTRSSFTQHSGTCSTKQFSVISGWNREASENKAQSFLLQRTQTFTVIRKHVFANQIKFPWSVLNEGSQQIPMFQGKQKKSFHWAQLKKMLWRHIYHFSKN